jgi:hypothetical protein
MAQKKLVQVEFNAMDDIKQNLKDIQMFVNQQKALANKAKASAKEINRHFSEIRIRRDTIDSRYNQAYSAFIKIEKGTRELGIKLPDELDKILKDIVNTMDAGGKDISSDMAMIKKSINEDY